MGFTSLPGILVMSLSYLYSELFDLFCFFVLCVGLRIVAVARFQSVMGVREHLTTWFDRKLPNILLIYLWPDFWMSCYEVELKGWLGMELLVRRETICLLYLSLSNSATAECPFPASGALRLWQGAFIKVEWWYKHVFIWPMYCMEECILVAVHSYGLYVFGQNVTKF